MTKGCFPSPTDSKIVKLIALHGAVSYAVVAAVISQQLEGKEADAESIAFFLRLPCDEVFNILTTALKLSIIEGDARGYVYSKQVKNEQEEQRKRAETNRANARRTRSARVDSVTSGSENRSEVCNVGSSDNLVRDTTTNASSDVLAIAKQPLSDRLATANSNSEYIYNNNIYSLEGGVGETSLKNPDPPPKPKKPFSKAKNSSIRRGETAEPYPEAESPVLLTRTEVELLATQWGEDELEYLVCQLITYSETNARKFAKYQDHYRTLRQWREKKLGEGKRYYRHEITGAAYYPAWQVEKWQA